MNYRKSRIYTAPMPKMPPGLIEIMESLSKEVLRNNPSNIYEFCADHMEKLLQIRNGEISMKKKLNLDRKISRAQEIIRQRAHNRREMYDKISRQQCFRENDREKVCPPSTNVEDSEELKSVLQTNNEDPTVTDNIGIEGVNDDVILQLHHINDVEVSKNENYASNDLDSNENLNLKTTEVTNEVNELEEMEDKYMDDINKKNEVDVEGDFSEKDLNLLPEYTENISTKDNNISTSGENEIVSQFENQIEFLDDPISVDTMIVEDCEGKEIIEQVENPSINSQKGDTPLKSDDATQCKVMDLETAAITIQKVFRSFLFKSKTASVDDATNLDINLFVTGGSVEGVSNKSPVDIKERRGLNRMDTVLQTVNEEKSLSLSTDDSSTLSSAATVIQAHIRGFLVRNKLNLNKSLSTSPVDSDILSGASLDADTDKQKTKTVLNIHIVPERGQFMSRDESLATSMDLSMDGSLSNSNLHPNSFNIAERRKLLKREDAIQSVSPPSNSSFKLSDEVDSVKEVLAVEGSEQVHRKDSDAYCNNHNCDIETAVESGNLSSQESTDDSKANEFDTNNPNFDDKSSHESKQECLVHSSEFHEVIIPTKVSRSDTSIVREFHNVLGYFLFWN